MESTTSTVSVNIHRETDVLALARAEKKKDYWQKVTKGILPVPAGQGVDYAEERFIYWLKQVDKYRERIEKHIKDFEKIKDPVGFLAWIAGVVSTIKDLINLITKSVK
ncbi:MAG: hypothetical protein HOP31_16665 [Ignavibacteria bacterium]|nr:hypothetical protein [Ignavibacteria bacterium]